MEGDELWYYDDEPEDQMDRDDEDKYFDLVERAEEVADNHADCNTLALGQFVSTLRRAIAHTTDKIRKNQMRSVLTRLVAILADRKKER